MNKAETAKVISTIQEAYPAFMNGRTPEKTIELWQMIFSSDDYKTVNAALLAFLSSDNKGFAPVPGQIKEKIAQMNDSEPDEMQAWAIVNRALSRASRAEFAKLPPLIQQCIGSPETFIEWSYMDTDAVDVTIANGFMRTYRARAQKQREYGKLPEFAKRAFPAIAAQEPYRLPPAKPKDPEIDDRVPVPDEVLQKISVIRGVAQRRELLQAAENGKRVDGLNKILDGMKGSKP
jgi:hypothetical protein